jgi:serine/threonine-protein kinase
LGSTPGSSLGSSPGQVRPPPRFGKFEILQLLGRGGMAEVFKARYADGPRAGTLVALKRLAGHASHDPEAIDLFTGEGDIARLLRHPNLVEILEAGFVDDVFYLAMEFVDGRDLAHLLNRCKERKIFLPAHFCVHIARRVLSALSFAHTALGPSGRPLNIVHCDVSPANVFLSRNGDIKLGDFGVARVAALGETDAGATVWGKLAYLAPEMLQRAPLTAAVDLWGVAAMLYEALTNQRLINGTDNEKLQAALRRLQIEPAEKFRDDLPPALGEVLRRALSRNPAHRYGTALELDAALAPFHDEQSGGALGIAGLIRGLFR